MALHSYPKVYNLGHRNLEGLMDGEVVIQEKIDGSQFSFGLMERTPADGADFEPLQIRSKNADIVPGAPPKMFARAVETVIGIRNLLRPGHIYRGEVLDSPTHNALKYERVPKGNVILFDVDMGGEQYFSVPDLRAEGDRLGLEVVPTLYIGEGKAVNLEQLKALLTNISCLGGAQYEGVVIKNHYRFGRDGKALMGKYVSEAFKEVAHGAFKAANPNGKDIIEQIGGDLRTNARWEKAIQHLRDTGTLQDAPQDIGPLLKEIHQDILAEYTDGIKDRLFAWAKQNVLRLAVQGFPAWYKERLVAAQFGGDNAKV